MCVSAKKHNKNDDKNEESLTFSSVLSSLKKVTLDEITENSKGKGISKSDITKEGTPCIRYGELYTYYNEITEKILSKTQLDKNSLVLSEYGDILIPSSGETPEDIATATCVLNENIAIGGDITILKTTENPIYLSYYINAKTKNIAKYAQGVSIVHLYYDDFKNIELFIHSKEEQEKIANFLSLIDKKIGLLEEKQEVFKKYKKEILKDTFSKKSNSEKIRISDLGSFSSGYTFKPEYQRCENSEIPFFKVSDLNLNKKYMKISNNYINKETCDKLKYKTINKPSIIFAKIGEAIYLERKRIAYPPFLIDNNLLSFQPSPEYSLEFIYYIFQSLNISRYAQKTALPSLPSKEVGSIECYIPSSKTSQRLITDFLIDLDKKNSIIEKNIMLVKNLKEFLLQNLFI